MVEHIQGKRYDALRRGESHRVRPPLVSVWPPSRVPAWKIGIVAVAAIKAGDFATLSCRMVTAAERPSRLRLAAINNSSTLSTLLGGSPPVVLVWFRARASLYLRFRIAIRQLYSIT